MKTISISVASILVCNCETKSIRISNQKKQETPSVINVLCDGENILIDTNNNYLRM